MTEIKPNDKAIEAEAVREVKSILNTISPVTDNETIAQNIVGKIIAAYAAQFQSGDYAGLFERLKNLACEMASVNDAIGEKFVEINEAADALEALLAEREVWKRRQKAAEAILTEFLTAAIRSGK